MDERNIYKKEFKNKWKILSDKIYDKSPKNKFQLLLNDFIYSDDFWVIDNAVSLTEYLQNDKNNLYYDDLCSLYLGVDGMKCFGSYTYQIHEGNELIMYHVSDLCSYGTYLKYKDNFNGFLCTITGLKKHQAEVIREKLVAISSGIEVFPTIETCLVFTIYFDVGFDYDCLFRLYSEVRQARDLIMDVLVPERQIVEKNHKNRKRMNWLYNLLMG